MGSLSFALMLLGVCGSYVANAVLSPVQLKKGCGSKPADIVFVVDESGSIWGPHFTKTIEFVKDVVSIFQIGPTKTRIGTLTFGTKSRVISNIDSYSTSSQVLLALDDVRQHRGGTRTYDAIDKMHNIMFSSNRARKGVPRIGIIITDGESEDTDMTKRAPEAARADGIILFAVGVGRKVNKAELISIASSPSKDYMFMVNNYAGLKTLRKILAWRACQVTTLAPPTTTTTTTTTTTPPPTTTLPQMIEECSGHFPLDLLFALPDEAGIDDTGRTIEFVKTIAEDMVMSPVHVQVGLTPRLCSLKKAVQLNANDNKEGFFMSLDDRELWETRIDNQLKYMRQEGFSRKNGARVQSVKFGVLIVDNKSADRAKTLKQAAMAKGNMKLLVIGVGDHIDRGELKEIASDGLVHFVDSYSELSSLVNNVVHSLCDALRKEVLPEITRDENKLLGVAKINQDGGPST